MKISNEIYISPKLNNSHIINDINSEKKVKGYALLNGSNDEQIFQIIRCRRIDYKKTDLVLLGVFKDKSEAFDYVKNIFQDAINRDMDLNKIKNYYTKVG